MGPICWPRTNLADQPKHNRSETVTTDEIVDRIIEARYTIDVRSEDVRSYVSNMIREIVVRTLELSKQGETDGR